MWDAGTGPLMYFFIVIINLHMAQWFKGVGLGICTGHVVSCSLNPCTFRLLDQISRHSMSINEWSILYCNGSVIINIIS